MPVYEKIIDPIPKTYYIYEYENPKMVKRTLSLIIFLFLYAMVVQAASQSPGPGPLPFKNNTCHTDFSSYPIGDSSSAEVVAEFLRTHLPNLVNKQSPIQLTFSQTSPGGYHYTFEQTYAGIPVFASEVMVNVSRKNIVYSIFDDSYDISGWSVNTTDFAYQDVSAYQAYLKQYFPAGAMAAARQVVAFDAAQNAPILCYEVTLRDKGHLRYALVSRDRLVYERDGAMYHHHAAAMPPDSTVTGMVNNPDPLTTAGVVYFSPYMGQANAYQNFASTGGILDSCTVQLDTQRVRRTFTADFVNDTFYLNSHYVTLANPENLGFTPATSITPSFDFYRCEPGFTDVMVYYHLNTIRSYVHDMGFNAADTPITADPHFYTADESFFLVPNTVDYGTGGVPDAEDADVVIHEYTHFLSWNANHSNGNGSSLQRNGIDEGSGDYDAGSYSASIDTSHWYWVFNWDGHNDYWPGRWLNETAVYPNLPTDVSGIWQYGSIWSSSLMQIWWAIGRGSADSLFFQTLYGLGKNITLLDAAKQYIKSDSLLFDGKYHCIITNIFNQHGLAFDSTCAGEYPLGVANVSSSPQLVNMLIYPDGFKAVPIAPGMPIAIDLYDMSGRLLASYQNVTMEIKPDLPGGVYIVSVSTQGYQQGYKWVNLR